jgi:hypothetical protein
LDLSYPTFKHAAMSSQRRSCQARQTGFYVASASTFPSRVRLG